MKYLGLLIILLVLNYDRVLTAQSLYFPSTTTDEWESLDPESLGWCSENIPALLDFLNEKNTKAFIVLKDGKIVLEEYFGNHTQNSLWYWASAGKTLTSFAVGQAEAEGLVDLNAPSSDYLGKGWTSLTPEQEEKIKVIHQLTMTSGLDDSNDAYCTDPDCLTYKADPGTRWAYHNGPYTLLDQVIEGATGGDLNDFIADRLKTPTGMKGLFIRSGYNNVYWSDARSMARFGLLVSNDGFWENTDVMKNPDFINKMNIPSQDLNKSYGYLWWLNGQESYMLPGFQLVIRQSISPSAPADLFAGIGKDGQIVDIVPSEGLVVVRMGEAPDASFVPVAFHDDIWKYLNDVICISTSTVYPDHNEFNVSIQINGSQIDYQSNNAVKEIKITSASGQQIKPSSSTSSIDISNLPSALYYLTFIDHNGYVYNTKFVNTI